MRGFIITVCFFIILIICIILNFIYINRVHDDMHQMVSQLASAPCEENKEQIEKIQEYWESKISILSISVNFREIDNLSNAIDSLSAANNSNNQTQFAIYKELTQNAIDAMMRLEKFSIRNII